MRAVAHGYNLASVHKALNNIYTSSETDLGSSPGREDVFGAFDLTLLADVPVIIVLMIPYPAPSRAQRLAFVARSR